MSKVILNVDSNQNVIEIQKYLSGYDATTSIYNGDYKSSWLLSDVHDEKWILKTNKTVKKENGEYKYVQTINWKRQLADGSLLTDEENLKFRQFIQKVVFIYRESPAVSSITSNVSLMTATPFIFGFISWCFSDEVSLDPRKYFLSRLSHARFETFFNDYLTGGTFKVLKVGERIITKFNRMHSNKIKSHDAHSLNKKEKLSFIEYLQKNNCYKDNNYGCMIVDRAKFGEIFNITTNELYGHYSTLFLRQFEPEITKLNKHVLLPINLENEFPGHTTPLIKEIKNKSYSYRNAMATLNFLSSCMKMKKKFPNEFPDVSNFKYGKLSAYVRKKGSKNNLTPWIPLPTCLTLINKSIGFVLNYGDKLIDLYADILHEYHKNNYLGIEGLSNEDREKNKNLLDKLTRKYSLDLGISRFYAHESPGLENKYESLRKTPAVDELIYILYGACFIIIAGLKPTRVHELQSLKYDCVYYKNGDGYWLEQEIAKSGLHDENPIDAKPIPKVSAKAIHLLQRLNDLAKKFSIKESKEESQYLLYSFLHSRFKSKCNASVLDIEFIRNSLAKFCDYIELPVDNHGRRWYVNIHELRKSFLLTFFWTYKFSSLDACRWIAGHKDPDHIAAYIEANLPGEEMVEVEAEYAQQQLRLFSSKYTLTEMENIENLYDDVCTRFGVSSISSIKESELKEWLECALESGRYKIHAYGIESEDPYLTSNVAITIYGDENNGDR